MKKSLDLLWYELYTKSMTQGITALNPKQTHLFTYIRFKQALQTEGLAAFLLNQFERMEYFLASLEFFGLKDLAKELGEVSKQIQRTADNRDETWGELLSRAGVSDSMKRLEKMALEQVDYIELQPWISTNYKSLAEGL